MPAGYLLVRVSWEERAVETAPSHLCSLQEANALFITLYPPGAHLRSLHSPFSSPQVYSVPLPHTALPSAPSHDFPFNIPLLRLHKERKLRRDTHRLGVTHIQSADWSGFTAMVSNVLLQFSRVLERKSWIPYPLSLLTPTELMKCHRRERERKRWRERNVEEHWRNEEAELEGRWIEKTKRLEGGRVEKGKIEESMIKRERNSVSVFLNLEMLNPVFSLQPAFLGH